MTATRRTVRSVAPSIWYGAVEGPELGPNDSWKQVEHLTNCAEAQNRKLRGGRTPRAQGFPSEFSYHLIFSSNEGTGWMDGWMDIAKVRVL